MKAPSPLLGFNNNFKHKGSVYHIQTEDSGVKHPHIITHLFADGGRILKSIKTSYAQFLQEPNMAEIVRQMMKEQHKAMIVALRDGRFDAGGSKEVDLPTGGYFAGTTSLGAVRPAAKPSSPKVDVEPAALEKAAQVATGLGNDLPPPPANVAAGGARPNGEYTSVAKKSVRPPSMRPGSRPPPAASHSDSRQLAGPPSGRPPSGRYAMTRPASIFATNKPSQKGSIFGEELISERSLDEVILAYLAEDLDGEKK
ncbi:MAG: hypothetical protein HYV09_27950 [Deltaproteobacteria bacterium]|nr:hypothetical protein [Deltaproteobacteria bacterium]